MVDGIPGLHCLVVVQVPVKDIEIEHVTTHRHVVMEVVPEMRRFMKGVTIVKVRRQSFRLI